MDGESHPIWQVYDELRTARLNVKYYTGRLRHFKNWNFAFEIVVAATTSGSAVAGLWFWEDPAGAVVWKSLIVVAAIISIVKPVLKYPDAIGKCEELIAGYSGLEHDLYMLRVKITQDEKYDQGHKDRFQEILKKREELCKVILEAKTCSELKDQCTAEVNKELPSESFFVPKEVDNG